jgi:hypothetical protein
MGLALGGLVSLPAWAHGWTPDTLAHTTSLTADQDLLLAELVEGILPETMLDGKVSPGAKSLKIHQFLQRMVKDCYPASAQATLENGLVRLEEAAAKAHGKSFTALAQPQRVSLLKQLGTSGDDSSRQFVNLVKNLTIQGYTNSEYYLTTVMKYSMAPGYYHGCVPLRS